MTKISYTRWMMETVQAFLKVSKLANKGQFERYTICDLPKSKTGQAMNLSNIW